MSVRKNYEIELKAVYDKLIEMCRLVQNSIEQSMTALINKDCELAKEIIANDSNINKMERDIEQECLKILLMEHPVASDFREVSAGLKMITDLERIADQSADIASLVMQFKGAKYCKELEHLPKMAKLCKAMVNDSVLSYINKDLVVATALKKRDDEIDKLFEVVKKELVQNIQENSANADQCILFMMIAKYYERIGDHAVNIGEWVEYTINGHHGGEDY